MLQKCINPTIFFSFPASKKIEKLQKKTICTRKMTQLPILKHLDLISSECFICIMSIVWCYCCKALAYNITALGGVIASKRAMSSLLSSLLTSWNGLGKRWNRIFRVSIVLNMTLHRWFCSILLIFSITVADSRCELEPLESPWNVFSFGSMFIFLSSLA